METTERTDIVAELGLPIKAVLNLIGPNGEPTMSLLTAQWDENRKLVGYVHPTMDGTEENPYMSNIPLDQARPRLRFLLGSELWGSAMRDLAVQIIMTQAHYDAGLSTEGADMAEADLKALVMLWDRQVAAYTGIIGMVVTDDDEPEDGAQKASGRVWDSSLGHPPME